MAATLQFLTTDVFTQTRYEGNPLAVVRLPAAYSLTQDQKQKIAQEFNLSETVILHESEESYRKSEWTFDIFLTTQEVPFAGHPTIGTICHLGRSSGASLKGSLKCKAGVIPFTYDKDANAATAEIPHDHHLHSRKFSSQDLEKFGLPSAVSASLIRSAEFVSIVKGMTFCMIELSSLEAMGRVESNLKKISVDGLNQEYFQAGVIGSLFFHHLGTDDGGVIKARTRMIMESLEDPATGSASSALAIYLALYHNKASGKKEQQFEFTQGVEMGRKSLIGVTVLLDNSGNRVEKVMLKGSAVDVTEGNLIVPP